MRIPDDGDPDHDHPGRLLMMGSVVVLRQNSESTELQYLTMLQLSQAVDLKVDRHFGEGQPSVTMIGQSVHGVRPQVWKRSRCAVGALVSLGCFSDADPT